MSLLDALEEAGIEVPNLCRGGVCGQCETGLLAGEAEHRDSFLPPEARGEKIMPCVSRARSARLVLDL
jgi:ferredoxin